MQDRAYQTEAEDAIFDFLINDTGNGILAMPGGCGKSYIMARLCKRLLMYDPDIRLMVLARDAKLLSQNSDELLNYWPQAPCGIYSAELNLRDTQDAIVFGGIQSIARRATEFGIRNVIFIDEADQVSPTEETQYQKFLNELKQVNPHMRLIGPTATAYRMGVGCLTNTDTWDTIIADYTKTERFNMFIEEGHLCKLVTKRTKAQIDITNVGMKCGEFNEKELQEVSDTDELNRAVVEECIAYGSDRKHWLVFASGVKHGHNLEKVFRSRGITAAMVSADREMKRKVKCDKTGEQITYAKDCENKFRSGEIRALINVGLFQRGWNFRELDMIVWVRATQSVALWIQGCLRGTRTFPGKESCTVLDFCGNIKRLGAVNNPIIPAPRRKGQESAGEAPIKECPNCHSYVPIQCKQCPDCDFIFPPPKTINKTASSDNIMDSGKSNEPDIQEYSVMGIRYTGKISKNGLYFLEVKYFTPSGTFKEALFFDDRNALSNKRLISWWQYRGGTLPLPDGTDAACERAQSELRIPTLIRVDINTKWKNVIGCEFEDTTQDNEPF